MFYDIKDKVRVFDDGDLLDGLWKVEWVSDDEEKFELENEYGTAIMTDVGRENIFYDWESDKLAICLIKTNLVKTNDLDEESEHLILSDETIDGLAESLSYNIKDVNDLYDWWVKRNIEPIYESDREMYHLS